MPKHEQSLPVTHSDSKTVIALAYEAMKMLGWNISMAGETTLLANTPKSWKKNDQQIICKVENGFLTIKSELIRGEVMDLPGNNKKNTTAFLEAYERARISTADDVIETNKNTVTALQQATQQQLAQQNLEQEEIIEAMNLKGNTLYVTYIIIGINLLVFILMAMDGAGVLIPNSVVHIKWGSNYSPLTLSGDWWRLLSNVFIHFGVIHVAMNMYCLYTVGVYLEPMLGKLRYATTYLCTGILASLVSLWWHTDTVNSAGASGAVFGMYGVFLALLTSNLIPKGVRQELLKSIAIFIGYNLIYGMKSGVDNAAHVGGLLSGFAFGYLCVFGIKKEKQEERQQVKWLTPVIALLTIGLSFGYLQQHTISDDARKLALNEVKEYSYKDNTLFNERLTDFDSIHNSINETLSEKGMSNEELLGKINKIRSEWKRATGVIASTVNFDISPASHERATKLLYYISLREEELPILKQMAETNSQALIPQLNELREKANTVFEDIIKQ